MGTRAADLPPRAGWNWLYKGWFLFRKNPMGMLVLTTTYMAVLFFLSALIPFAGVVMALILNPGLNAGLLTGCRMIDRGLPITPSVVFSPFLAENRRLSKPFIRMGVWYAICAIGISLLTQWLVGSIDTSSLMQDGTPSPELAAQAINVMAVTLALFAPVMMLFWFAPALVLWHEIPPGKSLFFSWVTVWRNRGAFLLYGMGWMLWATAALVIVGVVVSLLPLPALMGAALNFMGIIALFAVSQATVYPGYIEVFESHSTELDTID